MVGFWWPLLWPYPGRVWSAVGTLNTTGNGPVTIGPMVTIGGGGGSTRSNGIISTTGDLNTSWVGFSLMLTGPTSGAGTEGQRPAVPMQSMLSRPQGQYRIGRLRGGG